MIRHSIAAALALFAAPAIAGERAPTAEEAGAIDSALKAAGYLGWDRVIMEDSGPHWLIEGARKQDGSLWTLQLQPTTLGLKDARRTDVAAGDDAEPVAQP